MLFFTTNLPDEAPDYVVNQDIRQAFRDAVKNIRLRTDVLNEALELSNLEPNKFHEIASELFKRDTELFDSKNAVELAEMVKMLDNGKPAKGERLEFPNVIVLFDTAFTTEKEWESLRYIGIGGSDTAAIVGSSNYSSPRVLYHQKRGTPMAAEDQSSQAVFDRGHIIEERVIESFCKFTLSERIPETRMFASKMDGYTFCTANLDALIRFPDGRIFIFEAKTTVRDNKLSWTNDKIPSYYINQTLHYLAVMNDERIAGTYISCFFTSDVIVSGAYFGSFYDERESITHFVPANPQRQSDLLKLEKDFMDNYLIPDIEPGYGPDMKVEIDLNNRMNGTVTPEEDEPQYVTIESNAAKVTEYLDIKKEEKALNDKLKAVSRQLDERKADIIEEMKGYAEGRLYLDDKRYVEVKNALTKSRLVIDAEKLKFAFPDAYEACCSEEEGYRRFSISEKTEKKGKKIV